MLMFGNMALPSTLSRLLTGYHLFTLANTHSSTITRSWVCTLSGTPSCSSLARCRWSPAAPATMLWATCPLCVLTCWALGTFLALTVTGGCHHHWFTIVLAWTTTAGIELCHVFIQSPFHVFSFNFHVLKVGPA